MKRFVFWTGWISVFSGIGFQFSSFSAFLMPSEPLGMLLHLFGLIAIFLGSMLIICSRDLQHRGSLIIWEGILRLGGGALLVGYGVVGNAGMQGIVGGFFDLVIGIVYLVALPQYLGVSLPDLLLDRRVASEMVGAQPRREVTG